MNEETKFRLLGLSTGNLVAWQSQETALVHEEIKDDLQDLVRAAEKNGFRLVVASGFRHFERQRALWNEKLQYRRPVLDEKGHLVTLEDKSPKQKLEALLRFSALPGLSRHHWGTDVDVFNAAALRPEERIQLTPQEAQEGGSQASFCQWLASALDQSAFFRPYDKDRGGVYPEWWHLSHREKANALWQQHHSSLVLEHLAHGVELELLEAVREHMNWIFKNYFRNIQSG